MLRILSLVAVLLALVSQLALGAVVFPDGAHDLAALDAASIPCETPGDVPPQHHHPGDPCLCPLSIALALPAIVLTPAPGFPTPRPILVIHPRHSAQPRAPPTHIYAAAYPRGPPALA